MKFKSEVQLEALNNATVDTDKFLVSDSSTVKYRTGAEVLSDIGGQAALTNPITGTGTLNYVSKFTSATTLGNSQIFDNGTNVGIGTTSPGSRLDVNGNLSIGDGANGDQNILIRYGSSSGAYGAVRFSQSGTNNSTIHAFSTAWQGGTIYNSSTGAININGSSGVTFGAWNNIDAAFNTGGTFYFKNNVGIGTTSPSAKLDVTDTSAGNIVNNITVQNASNTAGTEAGVFLLRSTLFKKLIAIV